MPLTIAPAGIPLKVVKVAADSKTKKHLESLGIMVSAELRKISKDKDSVICIIKEGKLALDCTLASKIFVI